MSRTRVRLTVTAVAAMVMAAIPATGAGAKTDPEPAQPAGTEQHCVVQVVGERSNGRLVTADPSCFGTFAESMSFASSGTLTLAPDTSGEVMFSNEAVMAAASTFTLGIHYDGYNGTGSSITVVGSSCSGGWWNTPSWFDNRISSSWNGCYRLRHYNKPNRGGMSGSTYGAGSVHNVPWWINNKAESVSYS